MLDSHEGLLQLLESHVREIQNYNKEGDQLREEIKSLKLHIADAERNFHQMCEKYLALKKRRDLKVWDTDLLRGVATSLFYDSSANLFFRAFCRKFYFSLDKQIKIGT